MIFQIKRPDGVLQTINARNLNLVRYQNSFGGAATWETKEGVEFGHGNGYTTIPVVSLDPDEYDDNYIELPLLSENQYYNRSISPESRDWRSSGQYEITGAGKIYIAFFSYIDSSGGTPVTKYWSNVNNMYNRKYDVYASRNSPANNAAATLSGARRPRISFDIITIRRSGWTPYPDDPETDCLLVTLWIQDGDNLTVWKQAFFSLSFLTGNSPTPGQSTTPAATPLGGFGSRDNNTAGLDFPDITTISQASVLQPNANAHGLHIYALTLGQYNDLYAEMWSTQLSRQLRDTKYSPMQGIGSLHKMACTSPAEPTAVNIRLAGATLQTTGYIVQNQFVKTVYPFVALKRYSGTFLDFAPHTKVSVHLPYIGTVSVDPDCCIGGGLQICYIFDVLQGNCCAILKYTNRFGQSDIYGSYTGNCAYQSIVSGSDNGFPAVRGAVQTLATGAVNLAEGNMPGAALAALSAGTSLATAEHSFSRTGNTGGNAAALGCTDLFITVTSPQDVNTVENNVNYRVSNVGYPAAGGGTVGSYEGHWLEGIIHADLADATEAEKAEIERRIRGGLFI